VLLFGDSVMERVAEQDKDRRPLAKMLIDAYAERGISVCDVTHTAYPPRLFARLLEVLRMLPLRPRLVVLPLNLRAFSSQWRLHPEYGFAAELAATAQFIQDPSAGVPALCHERMEPLDYRDLYEQTDAQAVEISGYGKYFVGDLRMALHTKPMTQWGYRRRKELIFAWHYLYEWREDNEQLTWLRGCLMMLRDMQIPKLRCYITPVNYGGGAEFCGAAFGHAVDFNSDALVAVGRRYDIGVDDWGRSLTREHFFSPDDATEHLNEAGRRWLVSQIARG
jgi:hypothetical protein